MFRILRNCRSFGWLVATVIALQAVPMGAAQAGMVATETVIVAEQANDRTVVRSYLVRQEVRDALSQLGVDHDEAMARVAVMSDAEVAMIAANIEDEPAGQGAVSIVILAGLIALIVLLVADLSGDTDVF